MFRCGGANKAVLTMRGRSYARRCTDMVRGPCDLEASICTSVHISPVSDCVDDAETVVFTHLAHCNSVGTLSYMCSSHNALVAILQSYSTVALSMNLPHVMMEEQNKKGKT
jgi:hypothetical protein